MKEGFFGLFPRAHWLCPFRATGTHSPSSYTLTLGPPLPSSPSCPKLTK